MSASARAMLGWAVLVCGLIGAQADDWCRCATNEFCFVVVRMTNVMGRADIIARVQIRFTETNATAWYQTMTTCGTNVVPVMEGISTK